MLFQVPPSAGLWTDCGVHRGSLLSRKIQNETSVSHSKLVNLGEIFRRGGFKNVILCLSLAV